MQYSKRYLWITFNINNRINQGEKNIEFTFREILDLIKDPLIKSKDSFKKFYLYGIIQIKINYNLKEKIFIAFCRNSPTNKYFTRYRNNSISLEEVKDVVKTDFDSSYNIFKIPYILIYSHLD